MRLKDKIEELKNNLNDYEFNNVVAVNKLINNNLYYIEDIDLWNTKDYWATPTETIEKEAGDCEDMAILKYFLLKDIGVDKNKLELMYCLHDNKEYHMVLLYGGNLILDNIVKAVERLDFSLARIKPIYSFNESSFWIYTREGKIEAKGKQLKMSKWTELLKKIE